MTQAAIVDLVGVVSTAAGAGVGALASGGAVIMICLTLASRELFLWTVWDYKSLEPSRSKHVVWLGRRSIPAACAA